jgi:hypothetical protein
VTRNRIGRRDFLIAGATLAARPIPRDRGAVALVADPADPAVSAAPAQWAASELARALTAAGLTVRCYERPQQVRAGEFAVVISGMPGAAESLSLTPTANGLAARGADPRGLVYALLELADRAPHLKLAAPIAERPANPVRSVMKQFTSELLDKLWFYDRAMWPHYLTMLARHRFNRFHLAFGLGYDALQQVADSYFLFLYPFLVSVPGYNVRATNLPDAERDRNLETLRFISEEAVARGLDFQLGIWMHGYRYADSPRARNIIEGLTPETHAAYCRDALTTVLRACPAISSVSLRIHGESGIAEGSYTFWKTIFDGVKRCGRTVEIDLHAKGIDATMIANALATGMPVNVAPKYWAEHLGMPYHQAAIRELEMPVAGRTGAGLLTLSEGSRSFTRYGYADLLRDDRRYTVRHRVFSGTQRILLWGDPASAAAYSRAFQFCGSAGVDLMEPLTCRGRRGTAAPGTRTGYIDTRLEPRWDWEKYDYWYRICGRLLYNPDAAPEVWRRHFGPGPQARALETALANASRILPIVTTAYLPSAACDAYWPEIYWNQPLAAEPPVNPYTDTPVPKTFQHVSPLDPQLFSRIGDFAEALLGGERGAKVSPIEVAQWLEDFAEAAEKALGGAGKTESVDAARLAIDAEMQAGLGRFFAARFRSGVLYAIHERTGGRHALEESIRQYRLARAAWARVAERAHGVYAADLSASDRISERGQWADRLTAMDQDIAALERRLPSATAAEDTHAIAEALGRPRRPAIACDHRPPMGFRPGEPVELRLAVRGTPTSARLYYRHVNQAERYHAVEMDAQGDAYAACIPAAYTDSPYPLQYYFELNRVSLYPGFAPNLLNQPYFVLQRRGV